VAPQAGYSGTPLDRKLGVKPGHVVAVVGGPPGWEIPGPADGVSERRQLRGGADIVIVFLRRAADLGRVEEKVVPRIGATDALWLAWPRRAGGHHSDITDNVLRDALLPTGLVDVKVAALDQDWSGLKFVWRKELRSGVAARTGSAPQM
jgi:hypothetical protein